MTANLTDYQRAILQEMGLTVWQAQSLLASKSATTETTAPATQPTSVVSAKPVANGAEKLAQLKAQLGDKKGAVTTKKQLTSSQASTETAPPKPPTTSTVFSAQELANAARLCEDLSHAFSLVSEHTLALKKGAGVTLEGHTLTLPVSPEKLDAQTKREIWCLFSRLKS